MKRNLLKLILMVFILLVSACGGGSSSGGSGGNVTPDNGDKVTPDQQDGGIVDGEVGVSLQPIIVLRFSESLDVATVNSNNIYLSTTSNGMDKILVKNIIVTDENRVVHFSPDNILLEKTTYYVIVTASVKSVADKSYSLGRGLSFTTGDFTAPTVSILSPSSSATNVSIKPNIQLQFSEAVINVNKSTVTLHRGSATGEEVAISDLTEGVNDTFTFSPLEDLASSTAYYVVVDGGITDLAGNALTGKTFSFTTSASNVVHSTPVVNILSPTNGATSVSRSSAIQLKFSEAVDNVTESNVVLRKGSITGEVVPIGDITSGSNNTFTFSAIALLDGKTRYYVVLGSGITSKEGVNLVQTTFSFTTGDFTAPNVSILTPTNNATNVSKTPSIIIQFSEAVNNVTSSTVTLRKGSIAGEVVPISSFTKGSNNLFAFSPISTLDDQTTYYIVLSDAIVDVDEGNKLAATEFHFTTGDFTIPSVSILSPTNNATNVLKTPSIQLQFSEAVNNVTPSTVTLRKGSITGAVVPISSLTKGSNNLFAFSPISALDDQTTYYIVLSDAIVDENGNKLRVTEFHFTTGDFTAPSVSILSPTNNATNVLKIPSIQLQFSEAVNNVTSSTVTLRKGSITGEIATIGTIVPGNNNTFTFSPLNALAEQTTYYVVLSNGITDVAGNKLSATSFSFKVGDFTGPMYSLIQPVDNATDVSLTPVIILKFNEPVNNVSNSTIKLEEHSFGRPSVEVPIATIESGANNTYTIIPLRSLLSNTEYYVTLNKSIADMSGNDLEANRYTQFTTGNYAVPTSTLLSPANNSTEVTSTPIIKVQFGATVKNVNSSNIKLRVGSVTGSEVAISSIVGEANNVYSFSPLSALNKGATYYIVLSNGITSLTNVPLVQTSYSFTTSTGIPSEWVGGSSDVDQLGVYGTKGQASTSNTPGAREGSVTWTDSSGNMWLFGGYYGFNNSSLQWSYLNDLWKYNPSNKTWTWVSGSNTPGQPGGVYGVKGQASTSNIPSGRTGSVSWIDSSGNLWLFGGHQGGAGGVLNDLWKYNPSNNTWTWVSGANTAGQGGSGVKGEARVYNHPGARNDAVSWIDNSGNMWLFGGYGIAFATDTQYGNLNDLWKYNPSDNTWTWVSGSLEINKAGVYYGTASTRVPGAREGSASWTDSSGNMWLFGGAVGFNDLWKYDPKNNTWTWVNGSNTRYQAGVYGTKGQASTANIPGARSGSASWIDSSGNMWLFGGVGQGADRFNDLWKYNPTNNTWTWVNGSNTINQVGVYGTKGQASIANTPGARSGGASWIDSSNNLWFFGGVSSVQPNSNKTNYFNDLWKLSPDR